MSLNTVTTEEVTQLRGWWTLTSLMVVSIASLWGVAKLDSPGCLICWNIQMLVS